MRRATAAPSVINRSCNGSEFPTRDCVRRSATLQTRWARSQPLAVLSFAYVAVVTIAPTGSTEQANAALGTAALAVGECLQRELRVLAVGDSPDELAYLEHCFSQPICPAVDYRGRAAAFACHYLLTNFWKAYASFEHDLCLLQLADICGSARVLDLGCGSGAALLGCLAALEERLSNSLDLTVVGFDRSREQLDLAKKLALVAQPLLRHLNLRFEWELSDLDAVGELARVSRRSDLVIASHVFTENYERAEELTRAVAESLDPSAHLLVIERPDDPVWERIEAGLTASALPHHSDVVCVTPPAVDARLDGEEELNATPTRCAWTAQPTNPVLPGLVRRYFEAWRLQSIPSLADVFTSDAIYAERPFDPPLIGLPAIENYWRERVCPQLDPSPRICSVAYGDWVAAVEWETRMRVGHREKVVRGALLMEVEPASGLCKALREYYTSKLG